MRAKPSAGPGQGLRVLRVARASGALGPREDDVRGGGLPSTWCGCC
ncbi:hypothetical protein [Streptomyces hygroscopicus]